MVSLSLLDHFGSVASILGLLIGLPAILAAFYQANKARQEARQVREGSMHSRDCLEFIVGDGTTINVVPLETLNWLPREGDLILLPGDGVETRMVLSPRPTWLIRLNTSTRRRRTSGGDRKKRGSLRLCAQ